MPEHDLRRALDIKLRGGFAGGAAYALAESAVNAQVGHLGGEGGNVVRRKQSRFPVGDGVAHAGRVDAQNGKSRCHSLDHRERMDFRDGGRYERVAHCQIGGEVVVGDLTHEADTVGNPHRLREGPDFLDVFLLPSADDDQLDVRRNLGNPGERVDQEFKILFRGQAPRIDQQNILVAEAEVGARERLRPVETAQVHTVRDDFDVALHSVLPEDFFHALRGRNDQIDRGAEIGHVCLQQAVADLGRHQRQARLRVQVVAGMIGKNDRDAAAVVQRQPSAQEGVVDVDHVHGLEQLPVLLLVAQGQVEAGIRQGNPGAANDAGLVVAMIQVTKGEHIHFVPFFLQGTLIQINIIGNAADIRLVGVRHHSDSHERIVQASRNAVKPNILQHTPFLKSAEDG